MSERQNDKTEAEAVEWLRTKFPEPQYAVLPQVADGTGHFKQRTIDALIMSLWPSRGLHLYAVEYKRFRSDWLRELKSPAKAEGIAGYCHYFYVLAPKGVVDLGEVPGLWGLWEIDERARLLRTKHAAERQSDPPSLDYTFLAGILRAAQRVATHDEAVQAADREGYRRGFADGKESAKDDVQRLKGQLETVREFEEASGLKVTQGLPRGADLGKEVRETLRILNDPKPRQRQAGELIASSFRLYRAALEAGRALGMSDEDIERRLKRGW